jgi:hypothetical protein
MARDVKGTKYDQSLSIVQIAKFVREDIAAAIAAGKLPEMKVSVRVQKYSGGRSLHVNITELQQGFRLFNRERLRNDVENPHAPPTRLPIYTGAGEGLFAAIKRIVNAYNYDRSDIQSDYFDVNFYEHVGLHWEYEAELRKLAIASVRAPELCLVDLGDSELVYCRGTGCLPSHLELAAEAHPHPEQGGTCLTCGATLAPAQNAAPAEPVHFDVYAIGPCAASVCTTLPREAIAAHMNAVSPTGISSEWKVSGEPIFANGQPNGCSCNDGLPGARHWLMSC